MLSIFFKNAQVLNIIFEKLHEEAESLQGPAGNPIIRKIYS